MRLVFLLPLLVFALLLGIAGFTLYATLQGNRQIDQLPSMLIERPAPDISLPNLIKSASPMQLAQFRGEAVLVNFFASWCLPCRAEMPLLQELAGELTLVGIAYKDATQDTKDFLQRFGNPFHVIGVDLNGRAGIRWGVYGIPETFLIDPAGNVVLRHAGAINNNTITDILYPALKRIQ